MNDRGTIRTAIVSWSKSSIIQAYLQAPIHHKFEAIQQAYDILKLSHSYFENGVVVNGEKSRQYASFDVLNTFFDYQDIEANSTDEQKQFIEKFCSLSDIRMSFLMEHYLLRHLISYNTIIGRNDWNYEYANKVAKNAVFSEYTYDIETIESLMQIGLATEYSQKMSEEVQAKDQKLRSTGYRNYKK